MWILYPVEPQNFAALQFARLRDELVCLSQKAIPTLQDKISSPRYEYTRQ